MIYKEGQSIDLSEFEFLTEDESKININTIPIVENSRIGSNIVNFNDIERISKDYDISFNESLDLIKNRNNIDNITVSIDDYRIVESPEIVSFFDNIVIKPLSENDIVSIYCEEVCNQYLETMNESVLDNILDENKLTYGLRRARTNFLNARHAVANTVNTALDNNPHARNVLNWTSWGATSYGTHKALKTLKRYRHNKNFEEYRKRNEDIRKNNLKGFGPIAKSTSQYNRKKEDINNQHFYINMAAIPTMAYAQNLVKKILIGSHRDPDPKNFISKAIIKLRRLYRNWLQKAKDARDSKTSSMIKSAASKLLEVIDKLLSKIQNGVQDALG